MGVEPVISDAHTGLQAAIRQVLQGSSWQRCRVHFMRNLLVYVPKPAQTMVSALVRTIFAQPDQDKARTELRRVADNLEERFPKAAALLAEAEDDIPHLGMSLPYPHGKLQPAPTTKRFKEIVSPIQVAIFRTQDGTIHRSRSELTVVQRQALLLVGMNSRRFTKFPSG